MEKRERRERFRHSQAMKQRHGGGNRVDSSNNNVSQDNPRKGNRDSKPLPPKAQEEVIDHTAIPDPHMFDNLKRETDDIAALTSKKHSKRQVFSNWSKYEIPPAEEQDDQKIGEDYETLLRGAQLGSHYQLRSERSWDPKKLPTQNAAFTIDLGVLACSLSCLPLYERLDLPRELFSSEDLEHMERQARFNREQNLQPSKHRGKSLEKEGLALFGFLSECSELELRSLRGKSLERGDDAIVNGGGEEELNFGTPLPPEDVSCATVQQKVEKAIPCRRSLSPPPPAVPPSTEENEEAAAPATVENRSLQSNPPPSRQSPLPSKVEPTEEELESYCEERDTHEKTVKKKCRGGKGKTNKRRSMEVDDERDTQTLLLDKPLVPPKSQISMPVGGVTEAVPSMKPVCEPCPEAATVMQEKLSLPRSNKNETDVPETLLLKQAESDIMDAPKESIQKLGKPEKGDELDELLSLKKAAPNTQSLNFAIPSSAVKAAIDEDDTLPLSKPVIPEKKEDLEDWLDSMLDD